MRCKNCNADLSNDTKVCPYCGANLVEQENNPNQINFNKEYTYPQQNNKGCGCFVGFFTIFTILLIGCMCLFPVLSMFDNNATETIIDKSQLERSTTEQDLEEYMKENGIQNIEDIEQINIDINQDTTITVEEITTSTNNNILLNLGEQGRQLWNEDKTKIVGSFLRIVGDNYLFGKCSVENLKEFIEKKIEPVANEYKYVVVDFPTSDNGFVYENGVIRYGKLDKEERTYYFLSEQDVYGTFDSSNENELQVLIKLISKNEKAK